MQIELETTGARVKLDLNAVEFTALKQVLFFASLRLVTSPLNELEKAAIEKMARTIQKITLP